MCSLWFRGASVISVAVTMGDPAGVGPEVALRALTPLSRWRGTCVVLIGDAQWLRRVARRLRLPWPWTVVRTPDTRPDAPRWQLWDAVRVPPRVTVGRVQTAAGRVALQVLDRAIELVTLWNPAKSTPRRWLLADALVTAPVSKEAINRVAPGWTGHTEYLAKASGRSHPVMMFVAGPLRVSLVTTHQPLAQAIRAITPVRAFHVVWETVNALQRCFGIAHPKVGIAALNPHAGEGGLLGKQEGQWMAPLVRLLARLCRTPISGPHPADTVFAQAARGQYDAVVAMHHDQALIPVKLLAWERAVNVTLGLPFVRTSPAHGTAFDLAGTGGADCRSMRCAIDLAITMARHRIKAQQVTSDRRQTKGNDARFKPVTCRLSRISQARG